MKALLWGIGCGIGFFGACLLIGSHACGDFNIELDGEF